jgi:hypothetical protein
MVYKSAITSRAWFWPLPGVFLLPPALLVVADFCRRVDVIRMGIKNIQMGDNYSMDPPLQDGQYFLGIPLPIQ